MRSNQSILMAVFFVMLIAPSDRAWGADMDRLPAPVQHVLKKYRLPASSLSVYIKEIGAPQPLLMVNSDLARNPASVIKLMTTLAALEMLGPTYRWQTRFYLDGTLTDGVLRGNLVIQGSGDPFFATETFWYTLFQLQAKGLKHIHGDLLIDDSRFEDEVGSPGDFDNRPHRVYNVLPDAVLMNFSAHYFHLIPQEDSVHIYADPPAATMEINNRVRLSKGKCRNKHRRIKHDVATDDLVTQITLSGEYPRTCGPHQLFRSVISNDRYVYGVFKSLWEKLGGTIAGTVGKTAMSNGELFHVVSSRPLSEIITYINKHSNNVMARQLLLTIGKEANGLSDDQNRGSKALGRRAIMEWLHTIGISAPELLIDNGAGLSREVSISAITMGDLLEHAYHSTYQAEFFASLPLLGVDGTVSKRLKGTIPEGAIRIKTGLLRDVRTMAGYVKHPNNKYYIVVALHNHPGIQNGVGTEIQDEILKWLYFRNL